MLGELDILICFAGIVIAGEVHNAPQNAPTQIFSRPALQLVPIPLEAKILQSQQAVTPNSPAISTNQESVVQYPINSGIYRYFTSPDSRYAIQPAAVEITTPSVAVPIELPMLGPQPLQYHQEISEGPSVQYIAKPNAEEVDVKDTIPVAVKKLKSESKKKLNINASLKAQVTPKHPGQSEISGPAIQYVSLPAPYPGTSADVDPSQLYYAQGNPLAANPVAVPVLYRSGETDQPQYITVFNHRQPAPGVRYYAPLSVAQHVTVPIANHQRKSPIRYDIPTPTYSKPIRLSAEIVTPRPIPYSGYSRASKYSPASAVSSVHFSGLGVTYGW